MKPFLAFRFFILLLLAEEAICTKGEQKLLEFQAKLEAKLISSPTRPPLAPPARTSGQKTDGRVFYPIGYGADPTGARDSSGAILQVLNDIFQSKSGHKLLPGVPDFGGRVIDLQGGNYKISKPIRFPSSGGGDIVVQGGTLRASNKFPGDRNLIELWSPKSPRTNEKIENAGYYYEDITFRDILFDSSNRGGGILIVDSIRIRINNCFFLHFTTHGIKVERGHETFISSSFLGQHSTIGGDEGEKGFSGTAIDLASNDNAVTDVAIFSAAIGIVLRGQANILTGVHCYNKATYFGGIGILVKLVGASQTRIDNCYLDYTSIVLEDPVQVHVTNGLFLGNANVVLKSINGQISGLNIVDNMFSAPQSERVFPIIKLIGKFTRINQVVIDRNNVYGMSLKSTVAKLTVAGKGKRWVANFSSMLVFPNKINHIQYSLYTKGVPKFTQHAVTSVSHNMVVVESMDVINGVVSMFVDQYNIFGEKNFLMYN